MKNCKITIQYRLIFLTTVLIFFLSTFVLSQEKTNKDSELTELSIEKMISQINSEVDPEFVYDYEQAKICSSSWKNPAYHGPDG